MAWMLALAEQADAPQIAGGQELLASQERVPFDRSPPTRLGICFGGQGSCAAVAELAEAARSARASSVHRSSLTRLGVCLTDKAEAPRIAELT